MDWAVPLLKTLLASNEDDASKGVERNNVNATNVNLSQEDGGMEYLGNEQCLFCAKFPA